MLDFSVRIGRILQRIFILPLRIQLNKAELSQSCWISLFGLVEFLPLCFRERAQETMQSSDRGAEAEHVLDAASASGAKDESCFFHSAN